MDREVEELLGRVEAAFPDRDALQGLADEARRALDEARADLVVGRVEEYLGSLGAAAGDAPDDEEPPTGS